MRQRRAYRHQVAASIVKHCIARGIQLIALEQLPIPNLTKSGRGTIENPGKRVAQKRGLNRRILEQGWAELTEFIKYKARYHAIRLVQVYASGHLTDLLNLRKPRRQIPQGQAVLLHRLPLPGRRRPQRGTQHRGSGNVHFREAKGRHAGRHTPTAAHAARHVRASATRASDWVRSYATSVPHGLIWLSPFPRHNTSSLFAAMRGIANTFFART